MIPSARRTLCGAVALLVLLGGPAGALPSQDETDPTADETTPGWAVEPGGPGDRSWFVYQLAPGQTLRDTIAIENPLDEAITLDLYGADAFNTEDDAAFALNEADEDPVDVGTWLTIGQTRYTIEPGRRVEIPFEITVPLDASPGDHAGGIVGANIEPEEVVQADGATVSLKRRIGARVYVRVEGPLDPALQVSRLDLGAKAPTMPWPGGELVVEYEVRNVGNVRLTPVALLELEGLFGRAIAQLPAEQLPELLPGGRTIVSVEHSGGAWPLDRVTAKLTVRANDVTVQRSTAQWVVSPGLLVLIGFLVLVLVLRSYRRRRGARVDDEARESPPAKELVRT